jgi:hypothetical protein
LCIANSNDACEKQCEDVLKHKLWCMLKYNEYNLVVGEFGCC